MAVAALLEKAVTSVRSSCDAADRLAYARDLWPRHLIDIRAGRVAEHTPGAIVWPTSVAQVVDLVRFAREEGARVVPFGAGSGVCAAVLPDAETIVVDLKRMSDWAIRREAPLLDVQPGALGITLEEDMQREGFTIGHFPSSILCSTVGGWIAARGAGQCSGLYGKIEDMVASIECVLGTGEVVTMRRRFDGPNMLPLMIGSEGTLGIITRAELRLHAAPESRTFASFSFGDMRAGWDALREIFQSGLRPAVTRLYDPIDSYFMRQSAVQKRHRRPARTRRRRGRRWRADLLRQALRAPGLLNAALDAAGTRLLSGSTLILIFEGLPDDAHGDLDRATNLCLRAGGIRLGEGPARHWLEHRYSVSYRQAPVFRMGAFSDTIEVSAPWSKLGALYEEVRRALAGHVLVMAHMSHAYPDGCSIYFTFAGSAEGDAAARNLYDRTWATALAAVVEAGGAVSHHHGVGRSKRAAVLRSLGSGTRLLRAVMGSCDPAGIMNPGAVLPVSAKEHVESPRCNDLPQTTNVDVDSLLVTCPGETHLGTLEDLLARQGLTLGLTEQAGLDVDVASWIAGGSPGAFDRWSDPVDQVVAGLVARAHDGTELDQLPQPRRAVGPDLTALFSGTGGRVGRILEATLRVHRKASPRARALHFELERNPAMSSAESAVWERVATTAGGPSHLDS